MSTEIERTRVRKRGSRRESSGPPTPTIPLPAEATYDALCSPRLSEGDDQVCGCMPRNLRRSECCDHGTLKKRKQLSRHESPASLRLRHIEGSSLRPSEWDKELCGCSPRISRQSERLTHNELDDPVKQRPRRTCPASLHRTARSDVRLELANASLHRAPITPALAGRWQIRIWPGTVKVPSWDPSNSIYCLR